MAPQDRLNTTLTGLATGSPALQPSAQLLRVEDLSVFYGARQVVKTVGFELDRGKSLALIGESGSGNQPSRGPF